MPKETARTFYLFKKGDFRKYTGPASRLKTPAERALDCRTYWGSHGCDLPKGHEGHHECDCCQCEDHEKNSLLPNGARCVGKFPYYGPETSFYGEDATVSV